MTYWSNSWWAVGDKFPNLACCSYQEGRGILSSNSRIFLQCKPVPHAFLQPLPGGSVSVTITISLFDPLLNSLLLLQCFLLERGKKAQKTFSLRITTSCYVDTFKT